MANNVFEHLKMKQMSMDMGKDVKSTQMLDGGAKESSVMNETNSTTQHKTGAIPKSDLGCKNNLNG